MLNTLVVTYEGILDVKRNKLSVFICNYELFSMEEGEDCNDPPRCYDITTLNRINFNF